jgi:hypothetical protein
MRKRQGGLPEFRAREVAQIPTISVAWSARSSKRGPNSTNGSESCLRRRFEHPKGDILRGQEHEVCCRQRQDDPGRGGEHEAY